ncbi:MAG: excinuclease ABC subunit B [Pseudomonadota bacterium]
MRILALLLGLWPLPAWAWTFSPLPICTLEQATETGTTRVTFDPSTGIYAIALTRPDGWPPAPVFSIRFEGGAPLTISTPRHVIDGATLTVTDRGFGNVLAGLEFNATATAILGETIFPMDLTGAAEPVRAFRACPAAGLA